MMINDPTEAIHSELFRSTLDRYFSVCHGRDLGGAIAYLLLTFNAPIHDAIAAGDPEGDAAIEAIFAADAAYTEARPEESLFWYGIASPRPDIADDVTLQRWTDEECAREEAGAANGGVYYPATFVATVAASIPTTHPAVSVGSRLPNFAKAGLRRRPGASAVLRRIRRLPW